MRTAIRVFIWPALALLALMPVACGGEMGVVGPSSSSAGDSLGVVVRGTVAGGSASGSASVQSADVAIRVTVRERPGTSTVIASDGSFVLEGVPAGSFSLEFSRGGSTLGTLTFSNVDAGAQISVTVKIDAATVVLLDERRNGVPEAEVEGRVTSVIVADPAGESRFVVNGRTIVARAGATTIRHGDQVLSVLDVLVGTLVHVKGTALPDPPQALLAREIKVQTAQGGDDDGDDDDDGEDDDDEGFVCTVGRDVETSGTIVAKGASSLTVAGSGHRGDVLAEVSATTRIRRGNQSYTLAQLQAGWRVEVEGEALGLSGTLCRVSADEIKVQNTR